jgi:hypothetical protein
MYKTFFIILAIVIFSPLSFLNAQNTGETYKPLIELSPSSGLVGVEGLNSPDLNKFIAGAFQFGVSIAIILAVIMVIWGGVEYMTSESPFMKGEGKTRIGAAIGGLILALSTIVIFNTIDPNIALKDFKIKNLVSELGVKVGQFDDKVVKPPTLVTDPKTGEKGWDINGDGKPDYAENPEEINAQITANSTASSINATEAGNSLNVYRNNGDIIFESSSPDVCTDGVGKLAFPDPDYNRETKFFNGVLNANEHHYAVVPEYSPIPKGTLVTWINNTKNIRVRGFVGEWGPAGEHDEMSVKAASDLGIWRPGLGNNADEDRITIIFHTNLPPVTTPF